MTQSDTRLRRLDRLGHLLDDSIRLPIIGYRIGWDAIIGLIPGFGDLAGLALSAYIVAEAARLGAPRATLGRMVVNVVIEAVLGAVPVLGDLFDATFKANLRNLDLLHQRLGVEAPPRGRKADRRFLLVFLLGLAAVVVVLALLVVLLIRALLG